MAESDQNTGDKTEKATPQKLRKAREQGQVARSRDWATTIGLVASLLLLAAMTPTYLEDLRLIFHQGFADLTGPGTQDNAWSNAFTPVMLLIFKMVLPLALIPVLAGAASLYPGGWVMSGAQIKPRLERLNPLAYFKRIFKLKHATSVASAVLKAAALIVVLYHVQKSAVPDYLRLQSLPLDEALAHGAMLAFKGVMLLCAVFVIFALIDLPVQSFVFLREQRMSKRDVKEEHKTTEGRPEVRQRIRQVQLQIARRHVRKVVPTADVVLVNPEHYAVALKYDDRRAEAPFVVAKGVDETAQHIREVAEAHGVEVLTVPPLARAIYHTSQVNQQIPAALYKAVAQVLTYVLQLKAFRSGQRVRAPQFPQDFAVLPHLARSENQP